MKKIKKISGKHHTHRLHSPKSGKNKSTWRLIWIRVGFLAAFVGFVATSYLLFSHHTDVLGAQIAMLTTGNGGGSSTGGSGSSCTDSYIYTDVCRGNEWCQKKTTVNSCTKNPIYLYKCDGKDVKGKALGKIDGKCGYKKTAPPQYSCLGSTYNTSYDSKKIDTYFNYNDPNHTTYHCPSSTPKCDTTKHDVANVSDICKSVKIKPTPTPSYEGYQPTKCTSQTLDYQLFGPESLMGKGGSTTEKNNLFGQITASICTDEIYDSKNKVNLVEIKTRTSFDQLAKNAGATCQGKSTPDPLSDHDSYPNNGYIYPNPGEGARVALYLDVKGFLGLETNNIDKQNNTRPADSSTPDNRKSGITCPTNQYQIVFQYSPDAAWSHKLDKGSRLLGRLLFDINFGSYGPTRTIDLYSPIITVK